MKEIGWTQLNLDEPQTLAEERYYSKRKEAIFSESEKNESVSAGLGTLVPYGSALGPTYLGQSFKIKVVK